jgi:glycosyltransferase involved in cell wall biosynthesis
MHLTRRLGVVGTPVYPSRLDQSSGDVRTWSGIGPYFDDVTVIARTAGLRPRRERVGNVRYILIPRLPRLLDVFAFPMGASLIAFVYYVRGVRTWSFSDPLRCGLVCLAMRPLPGARLVVQVQGQLLRMPSDRFGRATPLVEKWARFIARRADTVRAVSRDIAREAEAAGVPPSRVVVVPSRCDTSFFDPERWGAAGEAMRASLPGDPAAPVVGFVGSLNASKGLDVLVRACTVLGERRALRLAVAGDGPLREELADAAARRQPPIALLGHLPPGDVPRFLSAIDVLAVPSYDEGLPRAVLEAMAMRVPVVASDVGGIPEAVQHGVNGLLVPSGDADALSDSLGRLIDNPGLARRLGAAARQRVLDDFEAQSGWRLIAAVHGAGPSGGGTIRDRA